MIIGENVLLSINDPGDDVAVNVAGKPYVSDAGVK